MGFLWFGKNRDGPKETRNQSQQMKDFIKGVDVDNQLGNCNSGVSLVLAGGL